jgi:hypothetical protein
VQPSQYDYQLPTFGHCPPIIGQLPTYNAENEPDWQSFADIDDTRPVEMKFEIPDILYELSCVCAVELPQTFHKVTGACMILNARFSLLLPHPHSLFVSFVSCVSWWQALR